MEEFQAFSNSFYKHSPLKVLLYWFIFALLLGACISVFLSDSSQRKSNLDCIISPTWSDWVGCSTLDCNSTGYRSRTVLQEATGDGLPCTQKDLLQTASCKTILGACAELNCQYSPFTPWSSCPDSCVRTPQDCSLIPSQIRTRNVLRGSLPGGDP